jgi:hypothetical protein
MSEICQKICWKYVRNVRKYVGKYVGKYVVGKYYIITPSYPGPIPSVDPISWYLPNWDYSIR